MNLRGAMPQAHQWSALNRLQVGRYAEYFVKMQFTLLGFDVYTAEVDDRGIDFVLRSAQGSYWDIQVKSIRDKGYVFVHKDKFKVHGNLLLALVIFTDGEEPKLFLIPSVSWLKPDGVLVSRDYEGLKSPPEYGINLSKKGIGALEKFDFNNISESLFGSKLPQPPLTDTI
jgi:hypothetical protein